MLMFHKYFAMFQITWYSIVNDSEFTMQKLRVGIMPATVKWFDEEKTIIFHCFEGEWTLQDYYQSLKESNELLETVDYKVVHFLDMLQSDGLPKGFLSAMRGSSKRWHPNSGRVVMIGGNPFVLAFSKLFSKIYPNPDASFFMVGSIDEALGIIGQRLDPNTK
jgi:hypothetical protein